MELALVVCLFFAVTISHTFGESSKTECATRHILTFSSKNPTIFGDIHIHIAQPGALPHTTCDNSLYEKVGCFNDKEPGRALPDLLINDKDPNSDKNDGHILNWHEWNESLHSLACRCREAAKARGFKFFSIQYFGECWSGQNAEVAYNKYGRADQSKCYQELTNPPSPCKINEEHECVGGQFTNYVYKIKEPKPADVNGGYTEWSAWTVCSKTCGGGSKVRERQCTNPPPSGANGKNCDHLGPAEETQACNIQKCPTPCVKAMDVGLIVDRSGSIREANFKKTKEFLANLVEYFKVSKDGTHVGVIAYSTSAALYNRIGNEKFHTEAALKQHILGIPYTGGWTYTDRALILANNDFFTKSGGDRPGKQNLLIVLTDGMTSSNSKPYKEVLSPLKAKGVRVVAVGIGPRIHKSELIEIAMGQERMVVQVANFDQLKNKIDEVLQDSCNANAGGIDGGYTEWSQWTKCTKTCGGGTQVRERTCTNPPPKGNGKDCDSLGSPEHTRGCNESPCPIPCKKSLDIGIILDSSGSVRRGNFEKAKTFLTELVSHFEVSSSGTHFGAIIYDTNPRLQFTMHDVSFHSLMNLKNKIKGFRFTGGWTRTDKALEMATRSLFTQSGGDRSDKANILLVFTDGKTNRGSRPYPDVLRPLQVKGVRTIAVGIGPGINRRELEQIAMNDPNFVVQATSFDTLKDKLEEIRLDSCQGAPPPTPDASCTTGKSLGMQTKEIPDSSITASSQWDSNHGPDRARLHLATSGGKRGAWSARYNDREQYLQVDLGKVVKITTCATQGRQDTNQWVTAYTLESSMSGDLWEPYTVNRRAKVFTANRDRHTMVKQTLETPIFARYIRIKPTSWYKHISMRAEFYGCRTGFVPPPYPQCMGAVGMQNGAIKDAAITASSFWNSYYTPSNGRLYFHTVSGKKGAWASKQNDNHQYLQVDLGRYMQINKCATQGRQDTSQWVKSYSLQYSEDGLWFIDYQQNGVNTIFQANRDQHTVVYQDLNPPIKARYIRMLPKMWHKHISMRAEFYGCNIDTPKPPPCKKALDVGVIVDASGSVGSRNFVEAKKFIRSIAELLQLSPAKGSRLGIIVYSSTAYKKVGFDDLNSQNVPRMTQIINSIRYTGGGTRTDRAIEKADRELFERDRPDKPDVLIVMTDGKTNRGSKKYSDVLKPLHRKNVKVVAVGIGGGIDNNELLEIASGVKENVIHVKDFNKLLGTLAPVMRASCDNTDNHPPPCKEPLDLGVIIDSSGSIGSVNFNKAKSFVQTLVDKFRISSEGNRLGIVRYSDMAKLIIDFSQIKDQNERDMMNIVKKIAYTGGGTRTDRALEMANTNLFDVTNGDRPAQRNILLVFTDGKTNRGSKPYSQVLAPLLKKNVKVVAIGVGKGINNAELLQIASGKAGSVKHVDDFEKLSQHIDSILRMSCPRYISCPSGWEQLGDQCYMFHNGGRRNHKEASDMCRLADSKLLTITDEEEWKFVKGHLKPGIDKNKQYVFGMSRDSRTKKWEWQDGSPVKVFKWKRGEPNGGDRETCGGLFANSGLYNDTPCSHRHEGFVCKKTAV